MGKLIAWLSTVLFTSVVLVANIVISCSTPKWATIGNKTEAIELVLNQNQIDSLYKADSLDSDWITVPLLDYETKQVIDKRMFIKNGTIYTILKIDSCYYLEKRINK